MKRALIAAAFCLVTLSVAVADEAAKPEAAANPAATPAASTESIPAHPLTISNESKHPLRIWLRPKREPSVRWTYIDLGSESNRKLIIDSGNPYELYVQCPDYWFAHCDEFSPKIKSIDFNKFPEVKLNLIGRYVFTKSATDPGKQDRHFEAPREPFETSIKIGVSTSNGQRTLVFSDSLVSAMASVQTLEKATEPSLPEPRSPEPNGDNLLEVRLRSPVRLR
jgi:hypothetical protein